MKKIFLGFFFLSIVSFSSASKGFEVVFTQPHPSVFELSFTIDEPQFDEITIQDFTFTKIVFASSVKTMKKGYAELPYVHATVMLSPDKNIQLEFLEGAYTDYALEHPLVPSRGTIYRDQDPATVPYEIYPGSIVDAWYPLDVAQHNEPFILKDIRGTSVFVYPFQYNAALNILRVYHSVKVRLVEHDAKPVINPLIKLSDKILHEMDAIYRSVFINYPQNREDLTIADFGDILVICTERDSAAIQPYIQWKKEKGYEVYMELVPTGTNVANLVQDQYNANNNILYVLLVGDWTDIKSNLLTGVYPMDPQLGCVVGTDTHADICIGRFSANDPDDVTVQVNKVIAYERDPEPGAEWYKNAIGIASSQGPGDDDELDYEHNDIIFTNKLDPFTYDQYTPIYDPSANILMVQNAVEAGASVINYTGHGSPTSWGTSGFSNSNVNQLTNGDMLPVIVSVACNNGDFHTGECFAEAWAKKENGGSIMFLGATISQPWDPPMRGQDYFMDLMTGGYDYAQYPGQNGISTFEGRTTIGSFVFNGLTLMIVESAGDDDLRTAKTWTMFGDPSLQVRTDTPIEVVVSNEVILVGAPYLTTVTANGEPVEGAVVALSKDGTTFSGITNENGEVSIEHSLVPGTCKLVVTGFNLVTIYHDATIIPPEGPYLVLEDYTMADEGGNGDHFADYGETVTLNLSLKNVGIETAYDVTATLSTTDSLVVIGNGEYFYGNVDADSVVSGSDFVFTVALLVPDMHVVRFDLLMRDNPDSTWSASISIPLHAPVLGISFDHVDDQYGNANNRLDPGETADICFMGINSGHSISPEATMTISSGNEFITLNSTSMDLGIIEPGLPVLASFNISISPSAPLGSVIDFGVTITAGEYTLEIPVILNVGLIIEDWETTGFEGFQWVFAGNAEWQLTEFQPYEGTLCAVSGNIGNNQTSELLLDIEVLSDGQISFFKKVSSEAGYDFLEFYIDNTKMGSWSGTDSWSEEMFDIPAGLHTLRWTYSKDYYVSGGMDCAWIDYIIFPPIYLPVDVGQITRNTNDVGLYPNPFRNQVTLTYTVEESSPVKLTVFSGIGQILETRDMGIQPPGKYMILLDASSWHNGIYYYTLDIDGTVKNGKMIRVR